MFVSLVLGCLRTIIPFAVLTFIINIVERCERHQIIAQCFLNCLVNNLGLVLRSALPFLAGQYLLMKSTNSLVQNNIQITAVHN